jgi:adenylosuccinate lyase
MSERDQSRRNRYENPLNERYASEKMQTLFSPDYKFKTWRKLWIALAETQRELGLDISEEQINQMRQFADTINYETAEKRESEVRHDVMAHVYAYGEQCPLAKGIIHLGATSCYVGDNTDLILMKEALESIQICLLAAIDRLASFADRYKDTPTLGFTHFQPAQLVTVGKRASLWIMDLLIDYKDLDYLLNSLEFLGSRGTTGTQASFMSLFDNKHKKVKELDHRIAKKMGFDKVFPVSGQTYSRKVDARVLNVLSGIAQSASKFSNDLRLLAHLKEMEEPFEKNQIGSSAMAYKRNPMRSERIASLSRHVITNALNPALTAASQWFERTLDDSANKRISIPEAFLAVDAILNLYMNIADGLVVYPNVIRKHLDEELPFMCTENIMMEAVKRGGDRQTLHEAIRKHSMEASANVKINGNKNDLLDRIAKDPLFGMNRSDLDHLLDPRLYIGRAPEQVEEFLDDTIRPLLKKQKHLFSEITPVLKV